MIPPRRDTRRPAAGSHGLPERAGVREEERSAERADRRPATEDDRGQRDEASAGGHVVLERPRALEGQVGAGQPGEDAADDDVPIPQPDDVDADRVRGLRMLPDRARAESPARAEQEDLQDDHEDDQRHRQRPLVEEHLEQPADDRDVGNLGRKPERLKRPGSEPRVRADEQPVQVARQAEGADVDDDAADDLVRADADREPRVEGGQHIATRSPRRRR